MEDRGFFSRPVLAEFPDGTPQTLLDAVFAMCPEAMAPPVGCRLRTEAAGDGAAAVRLECSVQLVVEQVGCCGATGPPSGARATAAAERAEESGGRSAPSGMPMPQESCSGAPAADAAELAGSGAGDGNAVEGAAGGDAATVSGSAVGRDVDGAAAGGAGDRADGVAQEEVDGGGAADAGAEEGPASCGGEAREGSAEGGVGQRVSADGGAVGGVGVARVKGGAGARGAGRHRGPYTRVVKGSLREGVSVYVGGVRAHAQDEVLRASLRLLHDVLFAPDLFLYVVIRFAREVGGGL